MIVPDEVSESGWAFGIAQVAMILRADMMAGWTDSSASEAV